jgi:hypothetical protein
MQTAMMESRLLYLPYTLWSDLQACLVNVPEVQALLLWGPPSVGGPLFELSRHV